MRTLGQYYREKVLCLPKRELKKVELPANWGNLKIEEGLFGWRLISGKEFVECRSEEEARYLKVFLDADMREILVPRSDEYLRAILPDLEKLKRKIDEILNSYLETIFDRKAQEQLRHEVFLEVTK